MPKYLSVEIMPYDDYTEFYKNQIEEIGDDIYCMRQRINNNPGMVKVYTYNKLDVHQPVLIRKPRGKYKPRKQKTVRASGCSYNKISVVKVLKALNKAGIDMDDTRFKTLVSSI